MQLKRPSTGKFATMSVFTAMTVAGVYFGLARALPTPSAPEQMETSIEKRERPRPKTQDRINTSFTNFPGPRDELMHQAWRAGALFSEPGSRE